jgi:type II secretory pathway pseudopilin PulG
MSRSANRQAGISLIELIVFIVVVGIVAVGLFKALGRTLPTDPAPQEITQANQLAQERMELILGQKDNLGFANMGINIGDPCVGGSPPGICVTAGFTVTVTGDSSTVACPAAIDNNTANCRSITVTVKDSATNRQLALLTSLVTNF